MHEYKFKGNLRATSKNTSWQQASKKDNLKTQKFLIPMLFLKHVDYS